jgi:hypothetical protein
MSRPAIAAIRYSAPNIADDIDALITYIDELEAWANRMPDAGITVDDPRLQWWYERPCADLTADQQRSAREALEDGAF